MTDALYRDRTSSTGTGEISVQRDVRIRQKAPAAGVYPRAVDDRFTEYESYSAPNWDGYGADPISLDTVRAARAFYHLLSPSNERPDIAPGADGTIGFEWRYGAPDRQKYILIDVGPGDLVTARVVQRFGKNRTAIPVTRVATSAKTAISICCLLIDCLKSGGILLIVDAPVPGGECWFRVITNEDHINERWHASSSGSEGKAILAFVGESLVA